jgi:hypothetical protein
VAGLQARAFSFRLLFKIYLSLYSILDIIMTIHRRSTYFRPKTTPAGKPISSPSAATNTGHTGNPPPPSAVSHTWPAVDLGSIMPRAGICGGPLRSPRCLDLTFGEQTDIQRTSIATFQRKDTTNFGFEGFADLVEEVFEGAVVGGFVGRFASWNRFRAKR